MTQRIFLVNMLQTTFTDSSSKIIGEMKYIHDDPVGGEEFDWIFHFKRVALKFKSVKHRDFILQIPSFRHDHN